MKVWLISLAVLATCLSVGLGAVWQAEAEVEIQYGKPVIYCPYKGLKLLPGTVIKNLEQCEKCTCRKSGLDCASIGKTITATEESRCVYVDVGCKGRWVRKSDKTRKCPRRDIPKDVVAVGK